MRPLLALVLAMFVGASVTPAQDAAMELRNVEIDAQSPEGSVLTQAGLAEDEADRIGILEGFRNDYPEST